MGDYDIKTTGTVDAGTVVARDKLCIGDPTIEGNCVTSMDEIIESKGPCSLIQECDAGISASCATAYQKNLNTKCSEINQTFSNYSCYRTSAVHNLTYTNDSRIETIKTDCSGSETSRTTTFNNSGGDLVGGSAFGITDANKGWYQVILKGESGNSTLYDAPIAAGGIVVANIKLEFDDVVTFKRVKGGTDGTSTGGAGVLMWDSIDELSGEPSLATGGGAAGNAGGGGLAGGKSIVNSSYNGKGYKPEEVGKCDPSDTTTNCGSGGGLSKPLLGSIKSYGGSGTVICNYDSCKLTSGGNAVPSTYSAIFHDNNDTGSITITRCGDGTNKNDCNPTCSKFEDCPGGYVCDFTSGICTQLIDCEYDSLCKAVNKSYPYCTDGKCSDKECSATDSANCTGTKTQCDTTKGMCEECLTSNICPDTKPICYTSDMPGGNYCDKCTENAQCNARNSGWTCDTTTGACKEPGTFTCCKWGTRDVCISNSTMSWSSAQSECSMFSGVSMIPATGTSAPMWNNTTNPSGGICGRTAGYAWLGYESGLYWGVVLADNYVGTNRIGNDGGHYALCVSDQSCSGDTDTSCPASAPYCVSNSCSATCTADAQCSSVKGSGWTCQSGICQNSCRYKLYNGTCANYLCGYYVCFYSVLKDPSATFKKACGSDSTYGTASCHGDGIWQCKCGAKDLGECYSSGNVYSCSEI